MAMARFWDETLTAEELEALEVIHDLLLELKGAEGAAGWRHPAQQIRLLADRILAAAAQLELLLEKEGA